VSDAEYYFTGPIEWDPGIMICMLIILGVLAWIWIYFFKGEWPKL